MTELSTTQEGHWWPAGTDDRVAGRLELDRDRLTLQLNGAFKSRHPFDFRDLPVIQGFAGSRPVTLRNCVSSGSTFGTGVPKQEFIVGAVWFGVQVTDFTVRALALELEELQEWAGGRPPTIERVADDRYLARHTELAERVAAVGNATIKIVPGHSTRIERTSATLGTRMRFDIELAESLDFDEAEDRYIQPLRNLISLAAARPVAITSLTAELAGGGADPDHENGTRQSAPQIATIHANWIVRPEAERRPLMPPEFTFTLKALGSNLDAALNAWFEANSTYRSSFNLFFGNYDAPPRYLETRFLVYTQALEVFHGKRLGHHRLAPKDHELRVERVLGDLENAADREWVGKAIQYSHLKSLADRARELAEDAPPEVAEVLGPATDFARAVSRLRNDLTHGGASARSVDDYFVLTHKLRLLLHAWFMRELGLSQDAISAALRESRLLREVQFIASKYQRAEGEAAKE